MGAGQDESPVSSSMRNSQEKRVGAEGERDNLKKNQNERQAIFGLLHVRFSDIGGHTPSVKPNFDHMPRGNGDLLIPGIFL